MKKLRFTWFTKIGFACILLFLQAFWWANPKPVGKTNLAFRVMNNTGILKPGAITITADSDTVMLEVFKCYFTDFKIYNGHAIKILKASPFLLNFEQDSMVLPLQIPHKKMPQLLSCNIGVDSNTNALGAQSGALDPIHGMYWTWQSGYINWKMEGEVRKKNGLKNKFILHIGGYKYPYYTIQKINLKLNHIKDLFVIEINLQKALEQIAKAGALHIMSPGAEAANYSNIFAKDMVVK